MIKLNVTLTDFKNKQAEILLNGEKIHERNFSSADSLEKAIISWQDEATEFLELQVINIPDKLISSIKYPSADGFLWEIGYNQEDIETDRHFDFLFKNLQDKLREFKRTLNYLDVSDVLLGKASPAFNTVQEKIMFILQKLYKVFDDNYYSISLIFELNEIDFRLGEPEEIADNLKRRGYGIRDSEYPSNDLLKISVKGAAYVERQMKSIKNKSKSSNNKEINEKIDSVLEKLEKIGLGQEIIFNEIEELRLLSSQLNKKTWSQLVKGKVMDLALSQCINKDVAKFIYESLVEETFRLLK